MRNGFSVQTPAVLLFLLLSGCAGTNQIARPGDQVQIDFACRLADGSLVETTRATIAGDDGTAKSPIFILRDSYRPFQFKVPEAPEPLQTAPFDPLEQKISVAIANRVNELPLNQATKLQLQSSQIEKFPPNDRFIQMAMKFTKPRTREMPVKEFEARYGSVAPVKGANVGGDSTYPGVIQGVKKDSVTIYFSAREGAKMEMPWGTALVHEKNEKEFEAIMDVHTGQLIQRIGGLPGRVSAIDEEKMIIDFGQSFAGETLFCDATARPYDSTQAPKQPVVDWVEDYDHGLALASQQNKPIILFLYSDGCPYCQQMLNRVFPNPSLDPIRNSFVWLKINSEKLTEYADRFGQQGYPLTLALKADGSEMLKLSGLQNVATLAYKLDSVLSQRDKN